MCFIACMRGLNSPERCTFYPWADCALCLAPFYCHDVHLHLGALLYPHVCEDFCFGCRNDLFRGVCGYVSCLYQADFPFVPLVV